MRVAVVTVGDELLAGDTENTNATWLCRQLDARGVAVERVTTLPDRVADIARVVNEYRAEYDAVVVTGGLGPTHDDVTMAGVAAAFGTHLEASEAVREWLAADGYADEDLAAGDGGTIVCITSRRTKEASPANILSSAVRMCIPGIMKALSRDLAPAVRVNELRPGPFTTPRNDPSTWDRKRQSIPLDRLGDPLEFGQVVAFLSSPRSGFLTGASIPVDGGSTHATL
jgi:molybdenum cofactor synthesis domain-containing protein